MKHYHYYVYILKCSDKSYYTGVTNNLQRRFMEHQSGVDSGSYTFTRRPLQLVFFAEFSDIELAIAKEKQIKSWSRRKKEALINENFDALTLLSKKIFE
jgi:putative endonuclease